jgi:S-methyl-5-thioribose-1-phosphate isomerase
MLKGIKNKTNPLDVANKIANEYVAACEKIGELGSKLIKDQDNILTHCNAGWLATVDWGTATAPIYKAKRQGKDIHVWVDETRPRCQGSRLTAFELQQEGINHTIIADNATGYYLSKGVIDLVIVGADRIAINGDIANKIGTFEKAVLAKTFGIPFYVAAPIATIDKSCQSGKDIPIEERDSEEVTHISGYHEETDEIIKVRIAPKGSKAANPAFDVTPAEYITGIITEKGIYRPEEIEKVFN